MGAVTSLGFGATPTAAALRGNIARPCPVDFDGPPVNGHPVVGLAEGFIHAGAWVRLGVAAAQEVLAPANAPPLAWERAGFWSIGPLPNESRFEDPDGELADQVTCFAGKVLEVLQATPRPTVAEAVARGHVGLAAACLRAREAITEGRIDRAVLVAADSYLDPSTLDWLSAGNRLKDDEHPTGLAPGEAGAALVLEQEVAGRPPVEVLGYLHDVAEERAPRPKPNDEGDQPSNWEAPEAGPVSRRLAKCIRGVLADLPKGERWQGEFVIDLAGEHWKAEAWGNTQVLVAKQVDFDRCTVRIPAVSVGETGAAASAVGVQYALHLFLRGAVRSPNAIVCSIADDGSASAIRLSVPPRSKPRAHR
jgi:3-oxoacyl-[acyl-carrier-protein] synthase-1